MKVYTALDLYDQMISQQLQTKFITVDNPNWQIAPSDLAIRFAKENFGKMRDLLEEEKMISKREEVLKRRMDIEYEELKYDSGAYDPVNRM